MAVVKLHSFFADNIGKKIPMVLFYNFYDLYIIIGKKCSSLYVYCALNVLFFVSLQYNSLIKIVNM